MIKRADINDAKTLAMLAHLLWQHDTEEDLLLQIERDIDNDEILYALYIENNMPIGFAQCGLRLDYVEGTNSCPVGYLEGIFVCENYRKSGVAKELLRYCETWARKMGCLEFASDCELDNTASLKFHLKVGFSEANRIICFCKNL